MEHIFDYLRILGFFSWFGIFCILTFYWCKGVLDGKSFLKIIGVLFAMGCGYELFQMVFKSTQISNTFNSPLLCSKENPIYINCNGWPIFLNSKLLVTPITTIAETIMKSINSFYGFSAGYAQYIAAMVLYSKLSRGIWSGKITEIFFAFTGGAIVYISLMQAGYIEKSFMGLTSWLYGFSNHHGSYDENTISNAVKNLDTWNQTLRDFKRVLHDQSIFSSDHFISLFGYIVTGFLYFIIKIPLLYFSILNIIMMVMQQFILMTIPIDAIKMSLSLNIDPFMIIKKLFSIATLSAAVLVEFQILCWFPTPPQAVAISYSGIGIGVFLGALMSGLVILALILIASIISTIAIFRAFSTSKASIEGLK